MVLGLASGSVAPLRLRSPFRHREVEGSFGSCPCVYSPSFLGFGSGRRLETEAMSSLCRNKFSPSIPRPGVVLGGSVGEVVDSVLWLCLTGEAVVSVRWWPFVPGLLPCSAGAGSGAGGEVFGVLYRSRFLLRRLLCCGRRARKVVRGGSFSSSASSLAQGFGSAGGRSGAGRPSAVPGAGLEGGSAVAVVRSLAQVPAFVVGRLLVLRREGALCPRYGGGLLFLLRRLAGGGVRHVEWWISSAVVLVFLLRLCVFQFVSCLVCSSV